MRTLASMAAIAAWLGLGPAVSLAAVAQGACIAQGIVLGAIATVIGALTLKWVGLMDVDDGGVRR